MRAARVGIAVLLMASLAACSGDNDDSAADGGKKSAGGSVTSSQAPTDPSQGPDPVAGSSPLPEVGQCFSLTLEDLDEGMARVSTAAAATDCSGSHNSISVDVVGIDEDQASKLQDTVAAGTAVDAAHEESWQAVVAPACDAAFDKAFQSASIDLQQEGVAAAYKSSTLRGYAWLPASADWQAGARWIRCDIANQNVEPISFTEPTFDLASIPQDLLSCMNADVEGAFPVACDDPLANAQALVTIDLEGGTVTAAKNDYESFKAEAGAICESAVTTGFPNAGKPGLAALPIEFAFTGRFDCYVQRSAGDPLITG